jgi:hypothetical protein
MLPAAAASTALGSGVAVGAFGAGIGSAALGTGLAAGATLAGGAAGLTGLMGGLGSAGALAPGAFGALAPAVATKLAPAAAAQAAGTIGTAAGSVAPGAFGANLAGAGQGLAGAGQGLAGAANQTLAQQIAQQQTITNAARQNLLTQAGTKDVVGMGLQRAQPLAFESAAGTPSFLNTTLQGSALPGVTSNLPAAAYGNAVTGPAIPSVTSGLQAAPAATQIVPPTSSIQTGQNFLQNLGNFFQNPSMQGIKDYVSEHPYASAGMAGLAAKKLFEQEGVKNPESNAMIRPYTYDRTQRPEAYAVSPTQDSSERLYFNSQFNAGEPYKAAGGGVVSLAVGGPVEQMAAMNAVGANTGYPQAGLQTPMYSNPAMQRPQATNVIAPSADAGVDTYTGEARFAKGGEAKTEGGYSYSYDPKTQQFTQLSVPTVMPSGSGVINGAMGMQGIGYAAPTTPQPVANSGTKVSGGIATPAMGPMQSQRPATSINIPAYQTPEQQLGLGGFYDYMNQQLGGYGGYARGGNVGGEAHLGDYSDGGRLLRGPGDGVSDSIPASIGNRQPARLADGEFVVPARIVSELGNGSTEAGARKLYAMMDRVQKGRRKSVGKGKVAVNSKADKYLPA